MSLLPYLLLALLAILENDPPAAANLTASVWYRALVSRKQLAAAATSTSYMVVDEMLCAVLATNSPWCHLFTYEGTTCVLYDTKVDSMAAAPPEGTAAPCKTRHRNVCIVEGVPVRHGETVKHWCHQPFICRNGALVPTHQLSTECSAPFSLVTMGCVYLQKEKKSWCEAREYCIKEQAELAFVPSESFSGLQKFLNDEAPTRRVWVGIKAQKWIDGRNVNKAEWRPGEPNGNIELCGYMSIKRSNRSVVDHLCTIKLWALCMRA